jgi:hypothetical protein
MYPYFNDDHRLSDDFSSKVETSSGSQVLRTFVSSEKVFKEKIILGSRTKQLSAVLATTFTPYRRH